MSILSEECRIVLKRAGFTDREISLYRQKFYNLLNIVPIRTDEIAELKKLREAKKDGSV